jgi:hypothetical protein
MSRSLLATVYDPSITFSLCGGGRVQPGFKLNEVIQWFATVVQKKKNRTHNDEQKIAKAVNKIMYFAMRAYSTNQRAKF